MERADLRIERELKFVERNVERRLVETGSEIGASIAHHDIQRSKLALNRLIHTFDCSGIAYIRLADKSIRAQLPHHG